MGVFQVFLPPLIEFDDVLMGYDLTDNVAPLFEVLLLLL